MTELFKSKKFQASLVGLLVALLAKVGLDLDEAALLAIVSPLLTYIGSQGMSDAFGKGKVEAEKGK